MGFSFVDYVELLQHFLAKRREIVYDIQRYISQQAYYLFNASVSAVGAWHPYVKNFSPNIGHDIGGRLAVAWLDR